MGVGKVTNLVEMQEKAVAQFGDCKLFGTKKDGQYQWITYAEFGERVKDFRSGLASLGIEKGDRVACISDNRVEWAVGAYATYSLGACFVPMYEKQNIDDWTYIINDSGAKALIVSKKKIETTTRAFIGDVGVLEHVIVMDAPADYEHSYARLMSVGKNNPVDSVQPETEDLAGFIYTSGTTGKPKGVLLTHGNFTSNINSVQDLFPMREGDRSLSFLPWAHSFGQTCELHCMIASGAAVGLAESVQTIIQNLPEVRPTLLFAVPRIFNKIYDGLQKRMEKEGGVKKKMFDSAIANANKRRDLANAGKTSWWVDRKHRFFDKVIFSKVRERFGGRLEYAFSGGAALDPEVAMFIDNLNIIVYEGYGLSETSPICTANYPDNRKIGSVGKAIPDVDVRIVPVEHIKEEGIGEIVVTGPNIMKGYYNLPEETAKAFDEEGAFRTGDLGRFDKDGYLYIVGRVKEQYKLENGKYVVPGPLEDKLQLSPFINQCMIDGANRLFNIALIVPDIDSLKEWAQDHGKSTDLAKLLEDEDVKKLFTDEIAARSTSFKGYERPKKFRLIAEEFSTENNMLTPKMSLKRRNVVTCYNDLIESMYEE